MALKNSIALIGFMGSGKTTLGKAVSKDLGLSFVDLDMEIEQSARMNISAIFSKYGEEYFRVLEREALIRTFISAQPDVLATGGGTPCFFDNIRLLSENYMTIWIDTPLKIIRSRIHECNELRPLWGAADINELFDQRAKVYELADHCVKGSPIHEALEAIKRIIVKI